MRSLALKLTLAFIFVSLIGAVLAAFFIQRRTQREFDRFLFDQGKDSMVAVLQEYYRQNGSWRNVAPLILENYLRQPEIAPHSPGMENPQRMRLMRIPYYLVDQNGVIVFGRADRIGLQVEGNFQTAGVPIQVEGETVGYLLATRLKPTPGAFAPEQAFLKNVNLAILTSSLIALLIALMLGAFLARALTHPLRELTLATREIASGNLGYQVDVKSKDELGDLAESFNTMSADLARASQARRQMTADIAHDLGTPLSVILGYSEALSDGKLEGNPEIYKVMHQESWHLKRLIDDLRLLSLADAGELSLSLQSIQPGLLLERCQSAYKAIADEKQIDLQLSTESDLPDVRVDPERMAQVLGNLLANAIRYTPTAGKIELSALRSGSAVCLRVQDSGSGISQEDLPNVFNRFYRGSKSRQSNGEAGLGLAIAKSLVEVQGGKISVHSEPGNGTMFEICLEITH